MNLKTWQIILASKSPRRIEILRSAKIKFTILPTNSSERFYKNLSINKNLHNVSLEKAKSAIKRLSTRKLKGKLILSADTIVVCQNRVLGKPKSVNDARRMLKLLSGRVHSVKTGYCIVCPDQGKVVTGVVTTKVGFKQLSNDEIKWYLKTKEPFDKAGSYGLQGYGQRLVNFIDGDFLNVIGLPFDDIRREFRKYRWNIQRLR